MPEIHGDSLEVSKEEERYLRRAFRRFALPYVGVLAVLVAAWGGMTGFGLGPAHDPGESTEVQGLIAESASLRQAIGALRADLDAAAARAEEGVTRVSSLEKRVEKLAGATEAVGASKLRKRLEEAHQRINALDARIEAVKAVAVKAAAPAAPRAEPIQPANGGAPRSSGTAGSAWPANVAPR
jgi:TolA-binding protein